LFELIVALHSLVKTFQEQFCHFFLDKKVIPAGNRKKSSLSNATTRSACALLAGQAANPPRRVNAFLKQLN
jgi:hypothetical protein